jgi:hypothetical protein
MLLELVNHDLAYVLCYLETGRELVGKLEGS